MSRKSYSMMYYARHIHTLLTKTHHWNERKTQNKIFEFGKLAATAKMYFSYLKSITSHPVFVLSSSTLVKCLPPVRCDSKDNTDDNSPKAGSRNTISKQLSSLIQRIIRNFNFDMQSHRESGHRASFRANTISKYENRLRKYSQPDKIFRYFATIKIKTDAGNWEIFMTPEDFVRSISPGYQHPQDYGLDKFRKFDPNEDELYCCKGLPRDSIFFKFHPNGLLTLGDYLFLHLVLSLPERFFEIAFRLFDSNGDGNLRREDLQFMSESITKGDLFVENMNIKRYFFGPNLNQKLNIHSFLQFQRQLNHDINVLEFKMLQGQRFLLNHNVISELSFAEMLLAYASMPGLKKSSTLKRIREKYRNSKQGITLEEFMSFFKFVKDVPFIDTALTFHYLSGANISRQTLNHVANVVIGVHLSDHVIDVIFSVFDEDNNGILSRNEFIKILKDRTSRTLKKNNKMGLRVFGQIYKCAVETFPVHF